MCSLTIECVLFLHRYPYDRAHEFHTEIKRLGVDDKGLRYVYA